MPNPHEEYYWHWKDCIGNVSANTCITSWIMSDATRSALSTLKQIDLQRMFESEATSRTTAEIVSGHRNTAASFFIRLSRLIAGKLSSCELSGEVEAEESCFGGIRKGNRWRGAPEKWLHSACLSGLGRCFLAIASNLRAGVLLAIIEEKVTPASIVCTDSFKTYNALDPCTFHHMRINYSELFADRGNYINEIENLWIQAKRHLWQFNVINKDSFHWFIEERERHFN